METTTEYEYDFLSDMKLLSEQTASNTAIRDRVIAKLANTVDSMSLDPDHDSGVVIAAKTGIVDTLLRAMDMTQSSTEKLVKLNHKLSGKEEDDKDKLIAATIGAFLSKIDTTGTTTGNDDTVENVDEAIAEIVNESGNDITEGELLIEDGATAATTE